MVMMLCTLERLYLKMDIARCDVTYWFALELVAAFSQELPNLEGGVFYFLLWKHSDTYRTEVNAIDNCQYYVLHAWANMS